MTIAQAISFIIQQFTSLVNAYQEGIEKLQEYKDRIDGIDNVLDDLNGKLAENIDKLREPQQILSPFT